MLGSEQMGFRAVVEEKVYFPKWYEYDSETDLETEKTENSIAISTYYNKYYDPYKPQSYKLIKFKTEDITLNPVYSNNYKINEISNAVTIYIESYSPRTLSNDGTAVVVYTYGYSTKIDSASKDLKRTSYLDFIPSGSSIYTGYYSYDIKRYIGAKLNENNPRLYGTYNGFATINAFGLNNGEKSPHLKVTWERCDPEIKDILPASGSVVDNLNGFRVSWTLDAPQSAAGNTFMPTDIQFLWGTTNNLEHTITLNLDPSDQRTYQGVDIPANTFPETSTIYWKIKWKSDIENTYWETELGTYSTSDTDAVVTPTYPVNVSINGEVDNVFTWEYKTDTDLPQYAFDFQYSNNDGVSWETLFNHQESTSPSCTVPANTFIAGTGLWKVRGYNTDDEPGEWSKTASIIVRAASKPPVISSVTTTPKVTITWQASGQQAFRLTAKNSTETYESGIVFGTGKTFTIPHYWEDSELKIAISIENRFGVWSDEATTAVIIQNTPSGNISLNGSVTDYGAALSWRTDSTFKAFYVFRDGVAIACVTDTAYIDYGICGESAYWIMGVTEDGNYTESEILNLYSAPEHAIIAAVDSGDWIELRVNRGGMPEITETHMEDISYQYYSGRMYPVAYSSVFRERTKTFGFTVWKDAAEKLGDLIGQLVILKDYTGGKIIGVLNNLQLSGYVRRPNVSFNITVIDYNEEVSFDV